MPLIDTDWLILAAIGPIGIVAGFVLMATEPSPTTAYSTVGVFLLIAGGSLAALGIYKYLTSRPAPPAPVPQGLRAAPVTAGLVAIALKRSGRRPEEWGFRGE